MQANPVDVVGLDKFRCRSAVDGARNDERRALDLFDRVHVVLDDRVDERLREAVRDRNHHMQAGALDG